MAQNRRDIVSRWLSSASMVVLGCGALLLCAAWDNGTRQQTVRLPSLSDYEMQCDSQSVEFAVLYCFARAAPLVAIVPSLLSVLLCPTPSRILLLFGCLIALAISLSAPGVRIA
jgi:hypothetical protein